MHDDPECCTQLLFRGESVSVGMLLCTALSGVGLISGNAVLVALGSHLLLTSVVFGDMINCAT